MKNLTTEEFDKAPKVIQFLHISDISKIEIKEFKRIKYFLTNRKEELTVAISLIKKLELKGIVDSNWDVHLNGL